MRICILIIAALILSLCTSCSNDLASAPPSAPSYPDTTIGRLGDNQQFHIQLNDSLRVLKEYYPTGIMAYEAHFTFNEYDGKATTWYATGNPMHSAFYIKGKLEGPCISWDENGNTKSIVHFKNGQIVQKSLSSTTSIETPLVNH